MAPKRMSLKEGVKGLFSGRRNSLNQEPEAPSKMRNLDKVFFGEEEDEDDEGSLISREKGGLLSSEPDRAETDFYNGDKYVGDVSGGKRHGHGVYYYDSGDLSLIHI